MREQIVFVKGVFKDIYFWGQGWKDGETYNKFHEAEHNIESFFWKLVEAENEHSSNNLVGVNGSVYLHPMGFDTVLHSCGCHSDDTFHCKDLKKICEEIAEHSGGSFEMTVSKPMEIEAEMFEYVKGIHNTL